MRRGATSTSAAQQHTTTLTSSELTALRRLRRVPFFFALFERFLKAVPAATHTQGTHTQGKHENTQTHRALHAMHGTPRNTGQELRRLEATYRLQVPLRHRH